MDKSPEAFRTISEVAESLDTPAHVLRFWESRFPQIRPVKRAGGRRYYRPADVALLTGIRHLLHHEGMTIRGVQKILREQGVRHVAGLTDSEQAMDFDDDQAEREDRVRASTPDATLTAQLYELDPALRIAVPVEAGHSEVVRLRSSVVAEPKARIAPGMHMAANRLPVDLPQTAPAQLIPEADHVWVEDEPELSLVPPTNLSAGVTPPADTHEPAPKQSAVLSGLSLRLHALHRPLSTAALPQLEELHSRLGLLHAQIAEAMRLRR